MSKRQREFEALLTKSKKSKKTPRMPPRSLPVKSRTDAVSSNTNSNDELRTEQQPIPQPPSQQAPLPAAAINATQSSDNIQDAREVRRRRKKLAKRIELMEHDNRTDELSPALAHYHDQARLIARTVHPFMRPGEVLLFGKHAADDFEKDEDAEGSDSDESDSSDALDDRTQRSELKYQYKSLLEMIPNLKDDLEIMDEDQLLILSTYLNNRVRRARGDDGGSLRDRMIGYMSESGIEDYKNPPAVIEKFRRGWYNWYTARMLCPQAALDRFDEDPDKFCETIMAGPEGEDENIIKAGNFPSFLYDQDLADPAQPTKGLLRGKSLWTGPGSARLARGRKDKTPGKPPIAWKYKLDHVTSRTLAYTAMLVRYELNSQTSFQTTDVGGFDGYDLFSEIVDLFSDPESQWCKDTLDWWDSAVFANVPGRQKPTSKSGPLTVADQLRIERCAAIKARKAAQRSDRSIAERPVSEPTVSSQNSQAVLPDN
ncbi:hypothetical protein PYCCODRAFT_1464372 [Trametes coccinea BRFM310]|uniref:Uncharacterized protein n=1 Tax=Trametes coccinea (strain BRFM310) TaxID=1353009 RepID=A0A1Y2IZA1_TRAC3|nr:hypothetical protein PYCCODRAFT_1464372 [Trametes coccinea BRFM310]